MAVLYNYVKCNTVSITCQHYKVSQQVIAKGKDTTGSYLECSDCIKSDAGIDLFGSGFPTSSARGVTATHVRSIKT